VSIPLSGVALAAGAGHNCALTASPGSVSCWGNNVSGALGDGTSIARSSPVSVSGLSEVIDIDAYDQGTVALRADGTVWVWGSAIVTPGDQVVPIQVPDISGAVDVDAGGAHACARLDSGAVRCFGNNDSGQLGIEVGASRPLVSTVPSFNASRLRLGGAHSCALSSGWATCWGDNTYGQLGDGSTSSTHQRLGVLQNAIAIATGRRHTCAIVSGGDLYCWGDNASGQIGDGTQTMRTRPELVLSNVVSVEAGPAHTCARLSNGGSRCWGANSSGQLGTGSSGPSIVTSPVMTLF
jgi:alpha-tubulin suppressor-like RCC1 family protein